MKEGTGSMCGICGVVFANSERLPDPTLLDRMTESLRHRGPDGRGVHAAPGVGLGMRRLSIIDPAGGDQPLWNEDGTLALVLNGEIYNYVELRRELLASGHRFRTNADGEVVLHLYEETGPECVRRLRGMFGLALWDAPRRRLLLARDRFGMKPLHVARGRDFLLFGSEIKSLFSTGLIERRIAPRALRDLATFGFVVGPRTLFEGVERVPPGCFLLFEEGTTSLRRYWSVQFPRRGEHRPTAGDRPWADVLGEKLEEAVAIHMRSDVPVGAWLSAGIDSSAVAEIASRVTAAPPLPTFTLDFEASFLDEVRRHRTLDDYPGFAITNERVLCRTADYDTLPQAMWYAEEPTLVEIPRLRLSEAARRTAKVVLTGEGSDEIFGGYSWLRHDRYLRPLSHLPLGLRRLAGRVPGIARRYPVASQVLLAPARMDMRRYAALIGFPADRWALLGKDHGEIAAHNAIDAGGADLPSEFRHWHPFNQLQYFELTVRLPDLLNHSLDRVTMAHSLEARLPFLDHELVEFCAAIPPPLKMRGTREKHVLREAVRGRLPDEIVQRPKYGLRGADSAWLRGHLPEFATELLSSRSLGEKGYFDPGTVSSWFAEHRLGRANYTEEIMMVLATQLIDEIFIRGNMPGAPRIEEITAPGAI